MIRFLWADFVELLRYWRVGAGDILQRLRSETVRVLHENGPTIWKFGRPFFNVYVAVNMLLCAVLFFPWAQPRETISGFLGRMIFKQHYWAWFVGKHVVDRLYFWEESHCGSTAMLENDARQALYPGIEDTFS